MTSATDDLRRLLDERGVEWGFGRVERRYTAWVSGGWHMSAKELADGSLLLQAHSVAHFTPEQAIDATRGRGTCHAAAFGFCSECGARMDGIYQHYCPNCGRRVVE